MWNSDGQTALVDGFPSAEDEEVRPRIKENTFFIRHVLDTERVSRGWASCADKRYRNNRFQDGGSDD